jgi:hypothetical protein
MGGGVAKTQFVAQWSDDADYDELIEIENALIDEAEDLFEVDGHDIGSGTFNVFMYAEDGSVEASIARVIQLFEDGRLSPNMKLGVAVYEDQEREIWTFKPAFPLDLNEFELI